MTSAFLGRVFSPAVKAAQAALGSRDAYSRHDAAAGDADELTGVEAAFIAARDSFYMASIGETGWPYMQHRGGPPGFMKVIDSRTLGFADFRGNRQYVTTGNLATDDRVCLFFMDYAQRARLKLLGRARTVDLAAQPQLAAALVDPAYRAKVERAVLINVEAFDWNCPQHITPRYTLEEIEPTIADLKSRIVDLERKLAASGA